MKDFYAHKYNFINAIKQILSSIRLTFNEKEFQKNRKNTGFSAVEVRENGRRGSVPSSDK